MSCGIYTIRNLINNKVYVGQSINIEKRWETHKKNLSHNCHINSHLQNAWNKYGANAFDFSILEICNRSELNDRETYWKLYYDNVAGTYNLGSTGKVGTISIEVKIKIRNKLLGTKQSEETKEKRRQKMLGQKRGHYSEESKRKMSEARKRYYQTHEAYWQGKKRAEVSKETRQKLSLIHKGKKKGPMKESTKKKLSELAKQQKRGYHGRYIK